MRGGVNALMFTAALATAGCVTDSGKLQIRPLADPFTKATKAGSPAVAEGRGLLAVGSIGLAIEAFRKALREQPDSIEALAGLAECYDQMGRHDLSQAKYEAALAIAPDDPTLLRTFAVSLERQGRFAEANELRGEAAESVKAEAAVLARMALVQVQSAPTPAKTAMANPQAQFTMARAAAPVQPQHPPATIPVAQRQAAPARIAAAQSKPQPPVPVKPIAVQLKSAPLVSRTAWSIEVAAIDPPAAASASVTVKLPPATRPRVEAPKIAAAAQRIETPIAEAATPLRVQPAKVAVAEATNVLLPAVPRVEAPKTAPAPVEPVAPVQLSKTEMAAAPSVTVKLPPARPAAVLPRQKPVRPAVRELVAQAALVREGPRLERLSLGEVALVTEPRPRWRSEAARQVAIGARPRFVPLAELQRGYGVRLLNAARHDGLAARTRLALNREGWRSITIGDSARIRQRSLVLYSEKTEKAARRLAAKFGFWIARDARPGPLTILLGRDWATRSQTRA